MDVSLKEHLEARIDEQAERILALERLMDAKQRALALAVEKQEAAYNVRFEGVNEWRQTFGDLVSGSVTREVFDSRLSEIDRRLNATENRLANYDGRIIGYSAGVGLIVLIISIATQLINFGG